MSACRLAAGGIGTEAVMRATPDGFTLPIASAAALMAAASSASAAPARTSIMS